MRKCYIGCDYCSSVKECGVFDGRARLLEEMEERCDNCIDRSIEAGRLEYRDAWWEYIGDYTDY